MSEDRCGHGRVTFTRTCDVFRCYECEPLSHEATADVVSAARALLEYCNARFDNNGNDWPEDAPGHQCDLLEQALEAAS